VIFYFPAETIRQARIAAHCRANGPVLTFHKRSWIGSAGCRESIPPRSHSFRSSPRAKSQGPDSVRASWLGQCSIDPGPRAARVCIG
jgi:hypothetical protein